MKRTLTGLCVLAASVALATSAFAQANEEAPAANGPKQYILPIPTNTAPEIPYDADANFFKLPPDLYFGETSGVAVNSKGHIFVFNRGNSTGPAYAATAAQILEFDQNGQYLREIGHNLYAWSFAHDIRIDADDNIWAVDKGSDMIIEFNPDGRVTKVFGRKKEASDEGAGPDKHPNPPLPPVDQQFRQPTDVTWDPEGNIFISDGYINSRVAMYDKNGVWKGSFGTRGTGPGEFNTPHGIDSDKDGNLYVADRANRRIQVFDHTGKFLRQITVDVAFDYASSVNAYSAKAPLTPQGINYGSGLTMAEGAPWAVCITPPNPQGVQYLYTADAYPGRIYKLTLDGTVVGVLGKSGKLPGQFGWAHQIACPEENTLFVAEILNWRVQKLTLHPDQAHAAVDPAKPAASAPASRG